MTDASTDKEQLLTTREVAQIARLHERTVLLAATSGALKSSRPGRGRGRLYRREWVYEWLGLSDNGQPVPEQVSA